MLLEIYFKPFVVLDKLNKFNFIKPSFLKENFDNFEA